MSQSIKRRLAHGIGAAVVATAASATLAVGAAEASTQVTPPAGITVPGDPTAAPAGWLIRASGKAGSTSRASASPMVTSRGPQSGSPAAAR